jgi:hypothetical protein
MHDPAALGLKPRGSRHDIHYNEGRNPAAHGWMQQAFRPFQHNGLQFLVYAVGLG